MTVVQATEVRRSLILVTEDECHLICCAQDVRAAQDALDNLDHDDFCIEEFHMLRAQLETAEDYLAHALHPFRR